ncbi:MAG: helix-turn-helix domain-containing protein, partial [Clostridia bacterium]
MTQKEMTRLRVINQTIDKVITIREAAELLDLSERQVIRLKKGVLKEGPAFIVEPENPQPAFRPLDPAIN